MPTSTFVHTTALNPLQWELICWSLRERQCILVLGPRFHVNSNEGQPLRRLLAAELAAELGEAVVIENYDLPYVSKLYEKAKGSLFLKSRVQQFYRRFHEPCPAALAVAQLPFHLIINCSPDHLLEEAYRHVGSACQKGYYSFGKQQVATTFDPATTNTFAYNLFGSIHELNSMVITQDHQMTFVQSVIQRETSLPDPLLKELRPDKVYIFLGFDYENWYMRLLLHLLRLNDQAELVFGLHDQSESPKLSTKVFFASQYRMEFVEMDDQDFLEELRLHLEGQPPQALPPGKTVCFLCDREDEDLFRALEKHLAQVRRRRNLGIVNNLDILAGANLDDSIQQHIEQADFIVPLVTSDFLASEAYERWLPVALSRHGAGAIVAPVLLRPCSWESASFAKLPSILPRNLAPVSRWQSRDEALYMVVEELDEIIK